MRYIAVSAWHERASNISNMGVWGRPPHIKLPYIFSLSIASLRCLFRTAIYRLVVVIFACPSWSRSTARLIQLSRTLLAYVWRILCACNRSIFVNFLISSKILLIARIDIFSLLLVKNKYSLHQ